MLDTSTALVAAYYTLACQLFKNGYPFSAIENKNLNMNYNKGTCFNAERLHFEEIIINEHIRLPNSMEDLNDIIGALKKVIIGE